MSAASHPLELVPALGALVFRTDQAQRRFIVKRLLAEAPNGPLEGLEVRRMQIGDQLHSLVPFALTLGMQAELDLLVREGSTFELELGNTLERDVHVRLALGVAIADPFHGEPRNRFIGPGAPIPRDPVLARILLTIEPMHARGYR